MPHCIVKVLNINFKNYLNYLDEEKVICAKQIEELKTKHKLEIETLNNTAKQNAAEYASQELIQIVSEHQQRFEKAKEIVTLKQNTV